MQNHKMIVCGIGLILFYLLIRYYVGRRRFNRRGNCGLQQFSSYRKAVITGILETTLLMIGKLCRWAGLILLAIAALAT
ncbi:hypothetical protein INP83_06660 [Mucilaginibacter sp. 21P]|uniref:hypothetical protein n=1 Tax=Mucilaginibacter sp. 21P TaxID=2778902 RepID=UPI001C571953|nr:hypothetical protein [Mucilaginibacter sp. 21P]QXV66761.1 hypothetical protein INP83_06660 [Mucilaginibacter sp. 21P]